MRVRRALTFRFWQFLALLLLSKHWKSNRPTLGFSLVAMTGKKIHRMTLQMVCSFVRAWNAIPTELIVVSDGTRSEDQIQMDFGFWKGKLIIADWMECIASYNGDQAALGKFADGSVYGRKMAAIIHYAKSGPVLFCDSDVLWFSPLQSLPDSSCDSIKVCEDIEYSYNSSLVSAMDWGALYSIAPRNVGVVYLNGSIELMSTEIDKAIQLLSPPYEFPEQTIMAALSRERAFWSLSEVNITLNDLDELFTRSPKWAARHYVSNCKLKYWRDAALFNFKELFYS